MERFHFAIISHNRALLLVPQSFFFCLMNINFNSLYGLLSNPQKRNIILIWSVYLDGCIAGIDKSTRKNE